MYLYVFFNVFFRNFWEMSDRMLPKLNRNSSMMSTTNTSGGYYSIKNENNEYHSLNGVLDSSPLKLFSRAKQSINTIYHEFYVFIGELYTYLDCRTK